MNKHFIAAALVATSFSALADGATYEYPQSIASNVARAEVRAELARAASNGDLVSGERSYVAPAMGRALSRGRSACCVGARAPQQRAGKRRVLVRGRSLACRACEVRRRLMLATEPIAAEPAMSSVNPPHAAVLLQSRRANFRLLV